MGDASDAREGDRRVEAVAEADPPPALNERPAGHANGQSNGGHRPKECRPKEFRERGYQNKRYQGGNGHYQDANGSGGYQQRDPHSRPAQGGPGGGISGGHQNPQRASKPAQEWRPK